MVTMEGFGSEAPRQATGDYGLSTAETADCCCPDACERDHGNE